MMLKWTDAYATCPENRKEGSSTRFRRCLDNTASYKKANQMNEMTVGAFGNQEWSGQDVFAIKYDGHLVTVDFDGHDVIYAQKEWAFTGAKSMAALAATLIAKGVASATFMAEWYVEGPSGERGLASDVSSRTVKGGREDGLHVAIFDIVQYNGSVIRADYWQRLEMAAKLVEGQYDPNTRVHAAQAIRGGTAEARQMWERDVMAKSMEGLVVHSAGRGVIKIKAETTQDLAIIGYLLGNKANAGKVGSVVCAYMDKEGKFIYAGTAGSGITKARRTSLLSELAPIVSGPSWILGTTKTVVQWVQPKFVVEIGQMGLNVQMRDAFEYENGAWRRIPDLMAASMRHPTFIDIRTDKRVCPEDCRVSQIPDWGKAPLAVPAKVEAPMVAPAPVPPAPVAPVPVLPAPVAPVPVLPAPVAPVPVLPAPVASIPPAPVVAPVIKPLPPPPPPPPPAATVSPLVAATSPSAPPTRDLSAADIKAILARRKLRGNPVDFVSAALSENGYQACPVGNRILISCLGGDYLANPLSDPDGRPVIERDEHFAFIEESRKAKRQPIYIVVSEDDEVASHREALVENGVLTDDGRRLFHRTTFLPATTATERFDRTPVRRWRPSRSETYPLNVEVAPNPNYEFRTFIASSVDQAASAVKSLLDDGYLASADGLDVATDAPADLAAVSIFGNPAEGYYDEEVMFRSPAEADSLARRSVDRLREDRNALVATEGCRVLIRGTVEQVDEALSEVCR